MFMPWDDVIICLITRYKIAVTPNWTEKKNFSKKYLFSMLPHEISIKVTENEQNGQFSTIAQCICTREMWLCLCIGWKTTFIYFKLFYLNRHRVLK